MLLSALMISLHRCSSSLEPSMRHAVPLHLALQATSRTLAWFTPPPAASVPDGHDHPSMLFSLTSRWHVVAKP